MNNYARFDLKRWARFFIIALFTICISFLVCSTNTYAVEKKASNLKGLTISPLRSEFEIEPGTMSSGTLAISNSSDKDLTVNLTAEQFGVINQQYDYSFSNDSDLIKWISFGSDMIELKAQESKKILFTINVPLSEEPGGRYICLFASINGNKLGTGINSIQRVASLLYITVSGDVTRSGELLNLNLPPIITGETKWSAALRNSGTTHFRNRYNAVIQNIVGKSIIDSVSGDNLILPGTIRSISDDTPLPNFPGIYKLVYTIGLGDTPARVETRYIIFLPLYAIAILIIISCSLIYYFITRKRKVINRFAERLYKLRSHCSSRWALLSRPLRRK